MRSNAIYYPDGECYASGTDKTGNKETKKVLHQQRLEVFATWRVLRRNLTKAKQICCVSDRKSWISKNFRSSQNSEFLRTDFSSERCFTSAEVRTECFERQWFETLLSRVKNLLTSSRVLSGQDEQKIRQYWLQM